MSLPLFSRSHAASPLQWILRLAGMGAAWTAFNPPAGAGEVSGRINVLLLLADNWAYPHSSFLGDRTVKTPNFDRLAREGAFFRHAFCPVPSCSPTRASILTGREPHELGEAVNLWSGLPTTYPSLTQELRRTGYDVGYTGKGWAPGNHVASGWSENPVGTRHGSLKEFLDQRSLAHPFFFWIGNLDTAIGHWDYGAGATADLDPSSVVVPAHLPDLPEVRRDILAYYNGVRKLDRLIGESRDLLERNGLLENTVIVCVSDNGWQVPRGLANCYDDGTHVPLVFWGKPVKGGRVVEDFVSLSELGPTLLDLVGLPRLPSMTTRSFVDLVRGRPSGIVRDAVFVERERHANVRKGDLGYPIRGIRTKDHLLLLNLRPERWPAGDPEKHQSVGPFGDVDNCPTKSLLIAGRDDPRLRPYFELVFGLRPAVELYDLRHDPGQVRNVAADPANAGILADLRNRVERWMADTRDPRLDPKDDAIDRYRYHGDLNTWDKDNFDGAHLFGR